MANGTSRSSWDVTKSRTPGKLPIGERCDLESDDGNKGAEPEANDDDQPLAGPVDVIIHVAELGHDFHGSVHTHALRNLNSAKSHRSQRGLSESHGQCGRLAFPRQVAVCIAIPVRNPRLHQYHTNTNSHRTFEQVVEFHKKSFWASSEKRNPRAKCIYPQVMPAHGWVEKEQEDKMLESVTSELTPKCDFQHATDQRGAMMKR